tara:strand:+ start:527 stop:664 length:138 start_codon:yes stop_codon:yes gene_type:complete
MINYLVYILILIILVFISVIAVRAINRGIEAKQGLKKNNNHNKYR